MSEWHTDIPVKLYAATRRLWRCGHRTSAGGGQVVLALDLPCCASMTNRDGAGLDRSLVRGMAWTGGVKWGSSLLTWGLTVATARLLTPGDYGVMGIAVVCMGFAQLISDVGLHATIIRAPDLTEDLAARLGGTAVMLAVAVGAITIGIAPLLADFFREPQVRWVITALSVTFLLRGIQVLRRALLARALKFKPLALIDASEAVVAALTALTFAARGAGYWSLVIGLVAGASVSTIACVLLYPHRLVFPRHLEQLEGTLGFGTQVLGGQLAWYAYSAADMVIVGRVLGSAALGAYTFAWVLAGIAVERIAALTGKVTPAIFSAVQRDPAAVRRYVYALTEGLAFITMPVCIGIALTADLIVNVALGPAWTAAIAPMRILAVYAAVRCVAVLFPQVLVYTGKARQSMHYNLIALVVLLPLFITGALIGQTSGVAWVWVLAFPVLTGATYFRELRKSIGLSTRAYFRALQPALIATGAMCVVVIGARAVWADGGSLLLELVATIALGATTYAIVVFSRYRRRFTQLLRLFRGDTTVPLSDDTGDDASAPAAPLAERGRILLICYHYPPDPAIGSLRWQKFSRHAAARGWGIDVIMRDEATIGVPDYERLQDLPEDVRRFGVGESRFWFEEIEGRAAAFVRRFRPRVKSEESLRTEEVAGPRSGRDILRAYFAFVEYLRMRRWAASATRVARRIIQTDVHRAIVACGPPFSACVAGRTLAKQYKLPLVIDLRDPWGFPQRMPESIASPLTLALNRHEEGRTVNAAQLVVANSSPVGDEMRARYPSARVVDVPNGYDAEDLPRSGPRERFMLAYAGTIYLDRNPATLFTALKRVVEARGLTPQDIGIEFMGAVERTDGRTLEDRAREEGVEAFVTVHSTRTRTEALKFLSQASMLVMLSQDSDMVIPGKLYEYMRFEAWLLALADPWSATARLLEGSAADVVPGADPEAIARIISKRYDAYLAGERAVPLAIDERFSRASRAMTFFAELDQVLERETPLALPAKELRQPALSAH